MFGNYKSWILVVLYFIILWGESVPTSKIGHCDTVALIILPHEKSKLKKLSPGHCLFHYFLVLQVIAD